MTRHFCSTRVLSRAIDSRVYHPATRITPFAISEIRALSRQVLVEAPFIRSLRTAFVLDRRVRSFASMPPCHARYLLIFVARWKPVSPRRRRRAERHASRRSSAARSASAARAFLSLERPRGSPVGYLARCFGVGCVAYCPGEPRLKPP